MPILEIDHPQEQFESCSNDPMYTAVPNNLSQTRATNLA